MLLSSHSSIEAAARRPAPIARMTVAPPVTMILDREGREVARFIGGADWASDEAKALIQAVIDG